MLFQAIAWLPSERECLGISQQQNAARDDTDSREYEGAKVEDCITKSQAGYSSYYRER